MNNDRAISANKKKFKNQNQNLTLELKVKSRCGFGDTTTINQETNNKNSSKAMLPGFWCSQQCVFC